MNIARGFPKNICPECGTTTFLHRMGCSRADPQLPQPGQQVISERAKIRGDFRVQSRFSQDFKVMCRLGPNWQDNKLTPDQKEALDEMGNKIARILTGDPNEADAWLDLIGYPTLIHNILTKGKPT